MRADRCDHLLGVVTFLINLPAAEPSGESIKRRRRQSAEPGDSQNRIPAALLIEQRFADLREAS